MITNNDELERLLTDRARAVPKEECFIYDAMLYDYAEDEVKNKDNMPAGVREEVKGHLDNCPYCYYSYLDTLSILKRPITEEEEGLIKRLVRDEEKDKAFDPISFIKKVIDKAKNGLEEFFASADTLTPVPVTRRRAYTQEEEKRIKIEVEEISEHQLVIIMEEPRGRRKVLYPHRMWEKYEKRRGDRLCLYLSPTEGDEAGRYTFIIFQVKDHPIPISDIPLKDTEKDEEEAKKLLQLLQEISEREWKSKVIQVEWGQD